MAIDHQINESQIRPLPSEGIKLLVYQFNMGDVEDPEIYSGAVLANWMNSEAGRWCKEHAIDSDLVYNIGVCPETYGYRCQVVGKFLEEDCTFFYLKYQDQVNFN